eukprot:763068-Hanusia_phi.AAC.2
MKRTIIPGESEVEHDEHERSRRMDESRRSRRKRRVPQSVPSARAEYLLGGFPDPARRRVSVDIETTGIDAWKMTRGLRASTCAWLSCVDSALVLTSRRH